MTTPDSVVTRWRALASRLDAIEAKQPRLQAKNPQHQLGTLGGGNHFIEICLDAEQTVWVMLHSGSRGIGNLIGQRFIEMAREDMRRHFINLPDRDLAYFAEGTEHFDDYVEAMEWAQVQCWAEELAKLAPLATASIALAAAIIAMFAIRTQRDIARLHAAI